MRRLENWPQLLHETIKKARQSAFSYGAFDCCLFAADVVHAMTGHDFGEPFRGRYHSEQGAVRLLKKHGGVAGIASSVLGGPVGPLLARRGDIVMIHFAGHDALGVCVGEKCAFASLQGLAFLPISECISSWRV